MLTLFFAVFILIIAVADVKKALDKNPSKQVGSAVENMLKTGRLVTQSTLDLKEVLIYLRSVINLVERLKTLLLS